MGKGKGSNTQLPNVDHVINVEVPSLSRAGRTEAAHKKLTKKAAEQLKGQMEVRKVEAAKLKRQREGVEFFEANTFGEGNVTDMNREEMCSSPRLHPQKEVALSREYRGNRMTVFQGIHRDLPTLKLLDVGGITESAANQYEKGITPRDDDDLPFQKEEGEGDTLTMQRTMSKPAIQPSIIPAPPAAETQSPKQASSKSPRKDKVPSSTAAFLSPSRWREGTEPKPPAVGHYRPKHFAVERRVLQGTIDPPHAQTARERPDYRPAELTQTAVSEVPSTARDTAKKVVSEPDATMDLVNDEGHAKKMAPMPDKNSTSAFKCTVPNRASPRATAAPDEMYWPRNDMATSSPPKGSVRFDRNVPRKPLMNVSEVPDAAVYNLKSTLSQHSPVKMGKQSPRKPPGEPLDEGTQYYNSGVAKDRKFAPLPALDLKKMTPRKDTTAAATTVSVEFVEGDLGAGTRPLPPHPPLLDRMIPRKENKIAVMDVTYNPDDSLLTHRTRAALIRQSDPGHQPLFLKKITDKCSYDPDPSTTRPKILRSIDFGKDTDRKSLQVEMHDLVYDVKEKLQTPRVLGNPMISQHLSRSKRNKHLTPRSHAPDVIYAPVSGGRMGKVRDDKGAIEFSKGVPRENVFKGRDQPSESWLRKNPGVPGPGSYNLK